MRFSKQQRNIFNITKACSQQTDVNSIRLEMTSAQQQDISSDRIYSQRETNIDYLECCICHKLLWKPVACQICETSFCSTCINQWLSKCPDRCPNQCEPFIERRCPPLTAKLLSQLQITCSYQSNGCPEVERN